MPDDNRFEWDGAEDHLSPTSGAPTPASAAEPASRRFGASHGRRIAIAGVAAGVVLLGGGAVAIAATQSGSPASHPGYGYGGYGGASAGEGPAGARGEGLPGGAAPAAIAHKPHLDGTVKTVSSTVITIKDRDGFTRTIKLSSATKYSGGLTAAPTVGTEIAAEGTVDADGTSLDATSVTKDTHPLGGPGGGPGGRGGPAGAGHGGAPAAKPSTTPSA